MGDALGLMIVAPVKYISLSCNRGRCSIIPLFLEPIIGDVMGDVAI